MGSYCSLHLGPHEVFSFKSDVPDAMVALFQDTDLVITPSTEPDEEDDLVYVITREVALTRLSLLGFGVTATEARFAEWLDAERARWEAYALENGWLFAEPTHDALKAFSLQTWRSRAPAVLASLFDKGDGDDLVDQYMRHAHEWEWLFFDGYGSLFTLRALLEACPHYETLRLDVSDLVAGGWIDEDGKVCVRRRAADAARPRDLAPTVVMAEGSSDIRILREALFRLFPELADYYAFFDHHELNVDGGANYLVKFLKAFAAARSPMQLVAVFDNDTIGRAALAAARKLKLPPHMILVILPDIELARAYPTVGPQGDHAMDVNGSAASLELYLGRHALTAPDGRFRPVRWTGHVAGTDAYQGEVEDKQAVARQGIADLRACADPAAARTAFAELAAVWRAIFVATEATNTRAQMNVDHRFELEW